LVGGIKGLTLAYEFLVNECFQRFIVKAGEWQEKNWKIANFS
jgi:hypothetical protein